MLVGSLVLALILQTVAALCPNWCSNHGYCTSPSDGGYCICEDGFTGADCATRMCPKAFDVTTLADRPNRRKIQLVTTLSEGKMYGSMGFSFGRSTVKLNPDANTFSSNECTSALKGLTSVSDVSCVRESTTETGGGSYLITLNNYPLYPAENNLFTHTGTHTEIHFTAI